jgi:hypothetical protein
MKNKKEIKEKKLEVKLEVKHEPTVPLTREEALIAKLKAKGNL